MCIYVYMHTYVCIYIYIYNNNKDGLYDLDFKNPDGSGAEMKKTAEQLIDYYKVFGKGQTHVYDSIAV